MTSLLLLAMGTGVLTPSPMAEENALRFGKQSNMTVAISGYGVSGGATIALGGNAGINTQSKHILPEPCNAAKLTFGDIYAAVIDVVSGDVPSSLGTGAEVTYKARVFFGSAVENTDELFLPGAIAGTTGSGKTWNSIEVTFGPNGLTSIKCPPGCFVESELIVFPITVSTIMVKTYATWVGNSYGTTRLTGNYGSPTKFWTEASELSNVDKTITALPFGVYNDGGGGAGKGPVLVEGRTVSGRRTKPIVFGIEDSRGGGAVLHEGNQLVAYRQEPLTLANGRSGNPLALMISAQSSEQALGLIPSRWNWRRLVTSKGDYLILELGYNDLAAGLAVLLNTCRSFKKRVNAMGVKLIVTTIYLNTTGGGTVKGVYNQTRIDYNDYIRSKQALGDVCDGFLEIADAVESGAPGSPIRVRNGGYWLVPDGRDYDGVAVPPGPIMGDETHTTDTGKEIIGRFLQPQYPIVMPIPTS